MIHLFPWNWVFPASSLPNPFNLKMNLWTHHHTNRPNTLSKSIHLFSNIIINTPAWRSINKKIYKKNYWSGKPNQTQNETQNLHWPKPITITDHHQSKNEPSPQSHHWIESNPRTQNHHRSLSKPDRQPKENQSKNLFKKITKQKTWVTKPFQPTNSHRHHQPPTVNHLNLRKKKKKK